MVQKLQKSEIQTENWVSKTKNLKKNKKQFLFKKSLITPTVQK